MEKVCGIYGIRNKSTGQLYIGSSVDVYTRWSSHRCTLRANKHRNPYLQHAWNKYGEPEFDFYIIETCDASRLAEFERDHIAATGCASRQLGYNLNTIEEGRNRPSTETKMKISAARKGLKFSEEHRQRLAESRNKRSSSKKSKFKYPVILQIDPLTGDIIRRWSSGEAFREYGGGIYAVLKGRNKTCKGFYWKLVKDADNGTI